MVVHEVWRGMFVSLSSALFGQIWTPEPSGGLGIISFRALFRRYLEGPSVLRVCVDVNVTCTARGKNFMYGNAPGGFHFMLLSPRLNLFLFKLKRVLTGRFICSRTGFNRCMDFFKCFHKLDNCSGVINSYHLIISNIYLLFYFSNRKSQDFFRFGIELFHILRMLSFKTRNCIDMWFFRFWQLSEISLWQFINRK